MRGSLREKRPGYWELRVYVGRDPATGKDRVVSRVFRGGKREAENELNAFVGEVLEGQHRAAAGTFGWLLDRWLDHISDERSPTTLRGYRLKIDRYIRPELADVQIRKLTALELDGFYKKLTRKRALAPATVAQVHAIVRRALNQAVRWKLIARNPALDASPPRRTSAGVHAPSVEEVAKLLQHADDEMRVFVRVAAATGCRRGELCALRRSAFADDYASLLVDRAVVPMEGNPTHIGRRTLVKSTKTHAGRRVALDPVTGAAVKARFELLEERCAAAGYELDADPYLFPNHLRFAADQPQHPDTLTHRFNDLRDLAGVKCRLHDLRHFVATQLIASGMDVRSVAGRLGHANPSTTLNVYSDWIAARDQDAAALLGKLLDG